MYDKTSTLAAFDPELARAVRDAFSEFWIAANGPTMATARIVIATMVSTSVNPRLFVRSWVIGR